MYATKEEAKADGLPLEVNGVELSIEQLNAMSDIAQFSALPVELANDTQVETLPTRTVKNVEIFDEGTWNGRTFTSQHISNLISDTNASHDRVKPFLKLGHKSKLNASLGKGNPALGWSGPLRRVGSKVVADFHHVPLLVANLIKAKAYRRPSVELIPDYTKPDGRVARWVMKAVALLGAETPAVESLNDIPTLYQASLEQPYEDAFGVCFVREEEGEADVPNEPKDKQNETTPQVSVEEFASLKVAKETAEADAQAAREEQKEQAKALAAANARELKTTAASFVKDNITKITPAFTEHAVCVFCALDDEKVETFSRKTKDQDGNEVEVKKDLTLRGMFREWVENLPEAMQFSESAHTETFDQKRSGEPRTIEEGRVVAKKILKNAGVKTKEQD